MKDLWAHLYIKLGELQIDGRLDQLFFLKTLLFVQLSAGLR